MLRASRIDGCGFCTDIHSNKRRARREAPVHVRSPLHG
ncbi:hypothetical protein ACTU45_03630 [Streptomyces sp. 24-1644]